jgi:hypothetical protein
MLRLDVPSTRKAPPLPRFIEREDRRLESCSSKLARSSSAATTFSQLERTTADLDDREAPVDRAAISASNLADSDVAEAEVSMDLEPIAMLAAIRDRVTVRADPERVLANPPPEARVIFEVERSKRTRHPLWSVITPPKLPTPFARML